MSVISGSVHLYVTKITALVTKQAQYSYFSIKIDLSEYFHGSVKKFTSGQKLFLFILQVDK